MPRSRTFSTVSFFAIFLVFCLIGLGTNNNKDNIPSYARSHDRADAALLAQRKSGRSQGLKYLRSPTGTAAPAPTPTCYDPSWNVPSGQIDVEKLCKCASYPQPDANINQPYSVDVDYINGFVWCETTCVPKYPNQTRIVDANESFSQCILACDGSFDKKKAKRTSSNDYWFCHGVNFVQGELCEFIGEAAVRDWQPSSPVECYDNGLTPSG